jgi:cytochrome c553
MDLTAMQRNASMRTPVFTPEQSASFLVRCAIALLLSASSMTHALDLAAEVRGCEGCHGPSGRADALPVNGRIAGQNEDYLVYILKQYRAGQLAGVNAAIMTYCVRQFSDGDIRALAHYYAHLQ